MTRQTRNLYDALLSYSYVLFNLRGVQTTWGTNLYASEVFFLCIHTYTRPHDQHHWAQLSICGLVNKYTRGLDANETNA